MPTVKSETVPDLAAITTLLATAPEQAEQEKRHRQTHHQRIKSEVDWQGPTLPYAQDNRILIS